MEPITIKELTKACGGRLLCGKEDILAAHISIDSRSMTGGDLFVPLAGE